MHDQAKIICFKWNKQRTNENIFLRTHAHISIYVNTTKATLLLLPVAAVHIYASTPS